MQEVFEKIIEKLEERTSFLSDCTKYGNKDAEQQNKSYSTMMMYEVSDLVDDLIEIVKQESEKYNNGWIPCSERLPEEGGYYLVTYHGWSNGDYLPKFDDTYVRRLHYQKSERFTGWNHPRYCDDKAENDTNREVIAWQPLPQPYQPKGE